jgi:peptide/nickel transport system permease protein
MKNKARVRNVILFLVGLHVVVLFAGFFSPYDAKEQNRDLPYAPPTSLHFTGPTGFHLRPFVYASVADVDGYREDPAEEYPVQFFVRGNSYSLLGVIESDLHLFGVRQPARIMLLGYSVGRKGRSSEPRTARSATSPSTSCL